MSEVSLRQAKGNASAWLDLLRRAPRGTPPRAWTTASFIVCGIVIVAVIVALMVTVDADAITAARQLPYSVHAVFGFITDFGKSGWFLWPIAAVLVVLCVVTTPRLGRVAGSVAAALAVRLTFVFVAIGAPGLFAAIVKNMIGRARPFVGGSANPFLYHPFDWKPAYASFPSGHSTTAVAAAIAIGALWPGSRPYVWLYAVVIMASRIIITAHHPSDVVGGAAVGAVGAMLVCKWFAARRLAFAVGPDGRPEAMPGPSWRRLKAVAARLFRP